MSERNPPVGGNPVTLAVGAAMLLVARCSAAAAIGSRSEKKATIPHMLGAFDRVGPRDANVHRTARSLVPSYLLLSHRPLVGAVSHNHSIKLL